MLSVRNRYWSFRFCPQGEEESPDQLFCPTGGLNPDNFRDYLALPNVICCGGSWMVGKDLVADARWNDIEALAREAMPP